MAVVTKGNEGRDPTADDESSSAGGGPQDKQDEEREEREERSLPPARVPGASSGVGGGFFHLYKPGQGYWTRVGTYVAAGFLVFTIAQFVYTQLSVHTGLDPQLKAADGTPRLTFPTWKLSIVGSLVIAACAIIWYFLNKPTVVDFMIATESEMKKVNWTTRKELVGSTKVVIIFMFFIAAALFVIDIAFGYFFFMIDVLKHGPFS